MVSFHLRCAPFELIPVKLPSWHCHLAVKRPAFSVGKHCQNPHSTAGTARCYAYAYSQQTHQLFTIGMGMLKESRCSGTVFSPASKSNAKLLYYCFTTQSPSNGSSPVGSESMNEGKRSEVRVRPNVCFPHDVPVTVPNCAATHKAQVNKP